MSEGGTVFSVFLYVLPPLLLAVRLPGVALLKDL